MLISMTKFPLALALSLLALPLSLASTQDPTFTPTPMPQPTTQTRTVRSCTVPATIPCLPTCFCPMEYNSLNHPRFTPTPVQIGTICHPCTACALVSTTRGVPRPTPLPDPTITSLGAVCTPEQGNEFDKKFWIICPEAQDKVYTWMETSTWVWTPTASQVTSTACVFEGCYDVESSLDAPTSYATATSWVGC
ncbi:hypothetical protein CC1G_04908 [Coprinopsis cinerea okayama7|uniref:Uncharacterized protein n=1 Tax=Coprinopsis cinerea (strain Okayama-7 / 130 / ATCC MYA-4618 / FGSC 9003) TaxID=240176 RepID=A8PFH5_COPC7|nr:hypothetical protein CC1G_04908 [Coprinopsis cinerea okayama7\|eukprot:XP_001841064.1 hypothetical protein CC1G_04908 [Coprinopsis cinerea okayama7\